MIVILKPPDYARWLSAQHDDVKPKVFTRQQARSDDRSLNPLFLPANSSKELYVSDACRDIVHCFYCWDS